jgi:uncharacterized cupin superfamily protein
MAQKPVINVDELDYKEVGDGRKFKAKLARAAPLIGAKKLGYNVTRVAPGKCAFPFHLHHGLEEMFFILEGEGTLRHGLEEQPVKKGDVIAFPPGPLGAHQIVNTGKAELAFLAVSTVESPDVVEYPDSGKVGAMAGAFAGPGQELDLRFYVKKGAGVSYFDGESD